ncbi:hypothetical protein BT69DRAFT_1303640 [Atractiella rhizophila]|nr:hypothetical protein BT69DRAFT_1303640 [Atractiella rhizophila]
MKFLTIFTTLATLLPCAVHAQGITLLSPTANSTIRLGQPFNVTIGHQSYSQNQQFVAAALTAFRPSAPHQKTFIGAGLLTEQTAGIYNVSGGPVLQSNTFQVVWPNGTTGALTALGEGKYSAVLAVEAYSLVGISLENFPQYANQTVTVVH